MEKIKTEDGSYTFYNNCFGDVYHSRTGAVEEAKEKFARPAIDFLVSQGKSEAKILDICFGLGYNSCAAIDLAEDILGNYKLDITGVEKDMAIIRKICSMSPGFQSYHLIKRTVQNMPMFLKEENIHIKIIVGDALSEITSLKEGFDIVFHDPFSPKSCPELWSSYIFGEIAKKIRVGGRLFTYSCARDVRENLKNAGFAIVDGPRVGRKAPSTIAIRVV